MQHLKSAQEKQNVNSAREFLRRMLCHYEFTFPFFKENILLVHTISEMGGGKKNSKKCRIHRNKGTYYITQYFFSNFVI